ncbi:transglutaminase family protein [Formosa algae]|jgi:transglutaminase-like putative cysteine protease|uniref:Transglutaminase-like putative cysteine protease n=1 Tax=Formosa algae TaxID=225843 RepID=A0A9X0YMX4_9FLAO|nr:transglutaminase family protein [Formosa algae]MBP1840254.1 transglutaminase-like putative cysteine protease [Formosa algae]MDQ0334118.1 transglutaminase-like putative cysteine protease [Formosa algae]OEI79443.1 cysteine protease [Formosa algae]PNW29466.1 cysteine protease [Formosa algae]
MWLRVSCSLSFDVEIPSPFILMLRPRSGAEQWIECDEFKITPGVPIVEFTDAYGNLCQRLVAPKGHFTIHTKSDVKTSQFVDVNFSAPFVDIQDLPSDVLSYLLPSRYCESDRFNDLANTITADKPLGYAQVYAIEQWLRYTIQYIPGSSAYPISAVEVNQKGSGVCRDLAHLGIALCRSLSIPARMVVGYLHHLKPMDMHAWFEAYVGGRWYVFDATQTGLKGGYVSVGYGLDAADVAIFNQFGPKVHTLTQEVIVKQIKI